MMPGVTCLVVRRSRQAAILARAAPVFLPPEVGTMARCAIHGVKGLPCCKINIGWHHMTIVRRHFRRPKINASRCCDDDART